MSKILEPFGLKFDMSKEFIAHNLSKIGLTLSNLGGQRKILVKSENFKAEKNVVSFELPTGSYATMCLREWSHGQIIG